MANDDRSVETVTGPEIAWLLRSFDLEVSAASPLRHFRSTEPAADEETLRERGLLDDGWRTVIQTLAQPVVQVRAVVPSPTETLALLYYGSGSASEAATFVECAAEIDHVKVSPLWSAEDVALVTSRVLAVSRGGSPSPTADLSLTPAGVLALAAAVDVIRDNLFASLAGRDPAMPYRFTMDSLGAQVKAGIENDDARWLVTLLRVTSPIGVALAADDLDAGFEELVAQSLVEATEEDWAPTAELLQLAADWRNPLPAVAHEVIVLDGETPVEYRYQLALTGDGPLRVLRYTGVLEGEPRADLTQVDVPDYLQGLVSLLTPDVPPSGSGAAAQVPAAAEEPTWVASHVTPQQGLAARTSPDPTEAAMADLAPGLAVQLVELVGDWARVRTKNGWEGWVDGRLLEAASWHAEQ